MPETLFSRRRFMRNLAFSVVVGSYCLGCGQAPRKWRFFSDIEAQLADAIAERIIPGDEDPGAREVGVVHFFDKQLVGFYQEHQERYRKGLAGVEEASRARFSQSFLELDEKKQIEVLKVVESGKAEGKAWKDVSSRDFFRMMVEHTKQGFYGSPRHGGNRNYASYRMLGIAYPPIIGQNRYDVF